MDLMQLKQGLDGVLLALWMVPEVEKEYTATTPSIETHLAMVRGLSTKKFLPKCVNEKSSTERHS